MNYSSKPRILVVDDELAIREMMSMLLDSFDYEITTAKDGLDGLLQVERITPDIIISDLDMPQMSGADFMFIVRRRFPQVPVIAMSGAYNSVEELPGTIKADAFWAKGSMRTNDLLRIIKGLIGHPPSRTKADNQP